MKLKDLDKKGKVGEIVGSKGDLYNIYQDKEGGYHCDCPARKKDCKHIKEYTFKVALERALTQLEYRGLINMQSAGAFDNIINWVCRLRKESL